MNIENFSKIIPDNKPENKIEKPVIKEGVDFVFDAKPELAQIGTKEQYSEYLDTIFPESVIKNIVYHGSPNEFDSFKNKETLKDFGIYFGNIFSHYHDDEHIKYQKIAVLNIRDPRIIGAWLSPENTEAPNNENIALGSADANNIKKFYNIDKEDGIIQLGHFHGNESFDYDLSENLYNTTAQKLITKLDSSINDMDDFFNKYEDDYKAQLELNDKMKSEVLANMGDYSNLLQEVVVFEPEQIHTLGSNDDLESFKKFIDRIKNLV